MPASASLTPALARTFARVALSHVSQEYPNKLDHVLNKRADLKTPSELHPVFFGSFDWHSCVHGYWLLATLLRLFPEIREAGKIEELLDHQLTPASKNGKRWSDALTPLADAFTQRFLDFLPRATYPTRVGTHFNSAFAIALVLEYAEVASNDTLRKALVKKARAWYSKDSDCQAWEPGGDDFLSSALMEAECMRRVLKASDFSGWVDRFLPRLAVREPATLFTPAIVSDRTDGKIAHLDGLNLSRAWCWRSIAATWPASDARRGVALEAAETHFAASLPHVAGDYMGAHWLATFALLALL